jgi:protein-tyrosine-phosphatase
VAEADLILTMSRGHLARVERLGGEGKAHLLGEYAGIDGEDVEVRDPYGGDVEGYRLALGQLSRLLGPARDRLLAERPS